MQAGWDPLDCLFHGVLGPRNLGFVKAPLGYLAATRKTEKRDRLGRWGGSNVAWGSPIHLN